MGRGSSPSVGEGVSRTRGGVASRSRSSDGLGVEAAELSDEMYAVTAGGMGGMLFGLSGISSSRAGDV